MSEPLLDRAGRRRSPATLPGFHAGHAPGNKGLRYPADPPKVEEIIAVMRTAGEGGHGRRLRGLIVIMWRAGLRIQEALALAEGDLDQRRGSLLVRRGKGGRRREVGMDAWGGKNCSPGLTRGASSQWVRCCALSTARRADATGRPPRHAPSCDAPPPRQECAAASRHTSFVTPTPSRWPAKACR
jgi:Phage integrase family